MKTILITGASRGKGAATALLAAERGFSVAVNYYKNKVPTEAIAKKIRLAGGKAKTFQADVSKEDEIIRLFDEVGSELGNLHSLVNNAGKLEQQCRQENITWQRLQRILKLIHWVLSYVAGRRYKHCRPKYGGYEHKFKPTVQYVILFCYFCPWKIIPFHIKVLSMNKLFNPVIIPKFLWKLHGKKSRWIDLILTYSLAIAVAIFNFQAFNSDSLWKTILLVVISFDIAGGVISNLTESTKEYYRTNGESPFLFLGTHLLHSLVLLYIFETYWKQTAMLSFSILLSAFIVVTIQNIQIQRVIATFLLCCILLAMYTFPPLTNPLYILLNLFALKLILAFAVRWK